MWNKTVVPDRGQPRMKTGARDRFRLSDSLAGVAQAVVGFSMVASISTSIPSVTFSV
jgi:hypothetical protein